MSPEASNGATAVDGVRLALLSNRFEGVARKMANTLLRTGRSGVLNTARDFSCCIVTADCELLATADSLPIHVLSGPDMMARAMKTFHPELRRGDAFLHNSPYHGCSHPADHTILVPIVDDDGRHRLTVVAKAHQADCGNSLPTTYMGNAIDVYNEGALIFPAVQVQRDFKDIADIVRMCQMRIRVPEQWWGDYLAMIGAARIGEREVMALAAEIGWDAIDDYARQWFDYSEQRMIDAIAELPSGEATRSSTHDPFPGTPDTGVPITVKVAIDSEAGRIGVDLRDNPDALPCGLNLSESCARTSAMVGIFNSLDHTVPKNAGSFRRIDLQLRENCVVGIPRHPTSCSVATTNIADRVANPVQCAIADIADGAGMAECGAVIPPAVGVLSGIHPKTGEAFVNQVFIAMSAGAGSPHNDAWLTIGHVGNAGLCYLDSIEIDELHHPILIKARAFVTDSEGAGRHKGAASAYAEFGPVGGSIEVGYVSDGNRNPAKGARGGQAGAPSKQFRRSPNGDLTPLDGCAQVRLEPGETIASYSTAGGGYGDPRERDPERVRRDVRERWITRDRAREVYGVVLTDDLAVDEAATAALRGA
ncbi:MAG: hydantoinase B/oxoprolinase family protein [Azospirillaceae bacterium]